VTRVIPARAVPHPAHNSAMASRDFAPGVAGRYPADEESVMQSFNLSLVMRDIRSAVARTLASWFRAPGRPAPRHRPPSRGGRQWTARR
jgi:hypothetical protein